MKTYDYLVSYMFDSDEHLGPCYGTAQISRSRKITTFDDVNELVKFLEEHVKSAKNVSIHNFILLGRNRRHRSLHEEVKSHE